MNKKITPTPKKKVKIALQGGGSYGAFSWGVLDRLLEDDRIEITAASGASAGAMNAVAMAQGMDENGIQGAREHLAKLWDILEYKNFIQEISAFNKFASKNKKQKKVSKPKPMQGVKSAFQITVMAAMKNTHEILERLLLRAINFQTLKYNTDGFPFFVSTTEIDENICRVFDRNDISAKALTASCAIPMMIGTVKIDGKRYWDGGLTDNPAIFAMDEIEGDLIVIQTFPIVSEDVKKTPLAVRLNTLRSNASIRKDINAIQKDNARHDRDPKAAEKLGIRKTHTHLIHGDCDISPGHAMNFTRSHTDTLFEKGRAAADAWLKENFDNIGVNSTFKADYKDPPPPHQQRSTSNPKGARRP